MDIDSVKGEYIFLLDRSGSMSGDPMESAKKALILFLKSLPIDSFFNVISFGSHSRSMFPLSVRNSDQEIEDSISLIKVMDANMGGTEI